MASKIPESEWSAVIARRENGEAVASIARSYDCSPALIYGILKRHENVAPATPELLPPDTPPPDIPSSDAEAGDEPTDPTAESAAEAVYEDDGDDRDDDDEDDEQDDEQDEVASKPPALAARLDADLRQDAEAAIRAFAAAFDAALTPASGTKDREELHAAASALMRAGARTIIVLERFGAPPVPAPVRQAPRSERRGAAPAAPPAGLSPPGAPSADAQAMPDAGAQTAPIPTGSVEGTVKWFKPAKRFGFIAVAGGEDVFVHAQALERSGLTGLQQGQRVRLTISAGAKGPQADRIELI